MFAGKSAGHEPGSPKFEKYFLSVFAILKKMLELFHLHVFVAPNFFSPIFLYLPVTWEKNLSCFFFLKLGQNFFVFNDGVTDAVTQKSEKASTSSSTSSLV